jgi:protein-tyrosine-phosphatase
MEGITSNNNRQSGLKKILAQLPPKPVIEERNIFLRLGPAGRTYAKLRLLDTPGMRQSNQRLAPPEARSFLFVCYGNIMRSPMAELMLKRALSESHHEGITVSSAGIHANPGTEAHPRARVAAREFGLLLDQHRSRLLTWETIDHADAVFAMDFQNQAERLTQFAKDRDKIFLLSAYAEGGQRGRAIADPYFGDEDETSRCYALLQICVTNLVKSMWPVTSQGATQQ